MPMQPRPIADTSGPVFPKCRVSIGSSLMASDTGFDECPFKPDTFVKELSRNRVKKLFSWLSPLRLLSYRIHFSRVIGTTPLLITGYPLGASKQMLTKHSQFKRIAPIKIIRRVPSPGSSYGVIVGY